MLPPLTNSLSPFHHVAIHFNNNSQSGDSGKSSSVPLPAGSPTGQWQFTRLISRFLFCFFFGGEKGKFEYVNMTSRITWLGRIEIVQWASLAIGDGRWRVWPIGWRVDGTWPVSNWSVHFIEKKKLDEIGENLKFIFFLN